LYEFFVQPMALQARINHPSDAGGWEPEDYWLVVGFMPAGRYHAMAMQIPAPIVLLVVGLLAFGLVCLPIIKVRYLGAREELRMVDVLVVPLAIIVATALATFALLFFGMYQRQVADIETRLEFLSDSVESHLASELDQLDHALVTLTDKHRSGAIGTLVEA